MIFLKMVKTAGKKVDKKQSIMVMLYLYTLVDCCNTIMGINYPMDILNTQVEAPLERQLLN